jgi:Leucine-rich repeat (LRR) protein
VESAPIPNLRSFSNEYFDFRSDVVSAVAKNYAKFKRLRLAERLTSSANLLECIESCRDIEELFFCEDGDLKLGDIEAIASLPRLRSLNNYCNIASDAVVALFRFRGLKHLTIRSRGSILSSIRPNLFSHRLYDPKLKNSQTSADLGVSDSPLLMFVK